jgi:hypothetical protein
VVFLPATGHTKGGGKSNAKATHHGKAPAVRPHTTKAKKR